MSDMPEFLKVIQDAMDDKKPTPEQKLCSHVLDSRMPDGKYFCMMCGLTSNFPLYRGKA
jgi:hypothetical protein